MTYFKADKAWNGAALFLGALLVVAAGATFAAAVETNVWWAVYLDFPRLQIAAFMIVALPVFAWLAWRPRFAGLAVILLAAVALGVQAAKLWPYSAFASPTAVQAAECPAGSGLTVMIANVQKRNERAEAFLEMVSETGPDLLLVMETDAWWDERLGALAPDFPETVQHIPENRQAYGMHLLSKRPLLSPEFRFLFDAFTPTAVTGVVLDSGAVVQLLGVHPQPPLAWSQPSTLRDASLLSMALEARGSDAPTIVAGDFNAVPWEPVVERAQRIGGLLDPRTGRGFQTTFHTGSVVVSWPLDQILFQASFALMNFEVLPSFGSDHNPVVARLCHDPAARQLQQAPELQPDDLEEAEAAIAAAHAVDTRPPGRQDPG